MPKGDQGEDDDGEEGEQHVDDGHEGKEEKKSISIGHVTCFQ